MENVSLNRKSTSMNVRIAALKRPRTRLADRILPDYTKGEEIFNMVSHIVGAVFGIVALSMCIALSSIHGDVWGIVSGAIYGSSLILLYTISSVYHGLSKNMGKKILQVIDHCTIYYLIAGSYTPILLVGIRPQHPEWAWTIFGIVWGLSIMAAVFTAIDHNKYQKLSMGCYLIIGWCIVVAIKPTLEAIPLAAILYILAGGIAYTVGAVLYSKGKRKHIRYMHSVFHLFVLIGTYLQFIAIFSYVL